MKTYRAKLPVLLVVSGGLLVLAACSPLGALDTVGPPGRASVMEGHVRSVDLRRARVEIRDHRNRSQTLRIDRSTRVIYRQRTYPVSALERGDVVRVRLARDRHGSLWAERIDVRESVRERGSVHARTERIAGTVAAIDGRRRHFTIHVGRNQTLLVHVPGRISRDDARRFHRLRRGDRVRMEVVASGRGTVQLVRFR